MPSASFSHAARVDAPRAVVWAALDRPQTWDSIAGVQRVHQTVIDDAGKLRGFLFDTVIGGTAYEGRASPRLRDEGRVMSWDIANPQIRGHIDVALADAGSGTNMTVSIEIASTGFLSGIFFGAITQVVGDGLPGTVEKLAHALGGGQSEAG